MGVFIMALLCVQGLSYWDKEFILARGNTFSENPLLSILKEMTIFKSKTKETKLKRTY